MRSKLRKILALLLAVTVSMSTMDLSAYAQALENVVATEQTADVSGNQDTTVSENEETTVSGNESTEPEENGWNGNTTESVYEGEGYRLTFTLSSYWEGGYNANVKVENTGNETIQDWYLKFNLSNQISNIWNAEIYQQEDAEYIIKNAGWNQDIQEGNSVEFGISANENFGGFPAMYELMGESTEAGKEDYSIEYILDSDWGSGFTGRISIRNNTEQVLEDWTLEFDFDRAITSIWDAEIESQEENHYVIRNSGYNSNIAAGQTITFGFNGEGGQVEDKPDSYKLFSYNVKNEYKVSFDLNYEGATENVESQIVKRGEYATKPDVSEREGYFFMGWYVDKNFSEYFQFDTNPIKRNMTLYARWLDYTCKTDSDEDGIVDSLEEFFETDLNMSDTDGDGLTDYQEVYEVGTNPLLADTDGNGLDDYQDDMEQDGLSNGEENIYKTNAGHNDSDFDNLSDYDEINIYSTNPIFKDTDMDGASDGWEINHGYNPLVKDDSFMLTMTTGTINEANPVIARVNLEAYDADVESLNISKVHSHDNPYITPSIAGYLGDAYDFTLDGEFDTAELIFEYDKGLGQLSDEFQPRIYYFNEDTKTFEELENQVVESGKVIATTTHFSTYILLNKVEFDKVWENEIKVSTGGNSLNIAYVVDLSGSMSGTKLSTTKTAINSFINILDDTDKASLISFTSSAIVRCNMTNDKTILKNAVNQMKANGLTSIYKGIEKALDVFENSETSGYNMIIVFTDGYDEPSTNYDNYYKKLVERANENNITIYTIGISTIDEKLLTKVAESTGGNYYYASVISELQEKVDELKEDTMDYTVDSNGDGITDYHTRLIKEGKLVFSNSSDELKGIDLNYDSEGNLTDDCDGDGLRNDEEIEIITVRDKIFMYMRSHPLRAHSDGDGVDDYTEVQRGSDPLKWSVEKEYVDRLCTDGFYYYEPLATDLRDDTFCMGLVSYSAIINGVWNKKELYRDLMIDYYSTYNSQNAVEDAEVIEEKKLWYDALTSFINNVNDYGVKTNEFVHNINNLISYVNGATTATEMGEDFTNRVSKLIVDMNRISEDATQMRFEVDGLEYTQKYMDSDIVKKIVEFSDNALDWCTYGIQVGVAGIDIVDTITNIAKIEANNQIFNENVEALEEVRIFGSDKNIRAAADELIDIIAEEYLNVYVLAISGDLIENGGNILLNSAAKYIGYIAVVLAVRDIMNVLVSSDEDVKQLYGILCYSDMSNAYSVLTISNGITSDNAKYYNYSEDKITDIRRYWTNLAQIRILGEKEYYAFMKGEGLFAFISDYFSGIDELKEDINNAILIVKYYADLLNIKLSSIKNVE